MNKCRRFVIFGQHGKSRVLRPVHVLANGRGEFTLCGRLANHAVPLEHLNKRVAHALAANFCCLHCEANARALNLTRDGLEMVELPVRKVKM